jgi:uncharacterized membrane protein
MNARRPHKLSPRRAIVRLLLAVLATAVAVAASTPLGAWWAQLVIGWNAGALTLIGLTWTTIQRADSAETERRASSDDPARHTAFVVALVSSMYSLFSAAFVLSEVNKLAGAERTLWTLLTLLAIALCWVLAHTAYTLRYAHLYYRAEGERGLSFPGDDPPADIDFAYFAFTIGMCFQVSDVAVRSRECRRAVLQHAALSFVYNTAILTFSLNIVLAR